MRSSRLAAASVAAGALVVVGASLASAEVTPNPVAPGGAVTVNDSFGGNKLCPAGDKTATATSSGFVGGSISMSMGTMTLVGSGKAVSTPGSYQYNVACAGGINSGPGVFFTVGSGSAKTGDGASQGSNASELAVGGAAVAGAAALGAVAMRRRRAGAEA